MKVSKPCANTYQKCTSMTFPGKKFCCDSCKYWYNLIKKEKEAHLPPAKKRNRNFFSMVIGSEIARMKGGARQGKRTGGGMITGSMSAMVRCTVEKWVEYNVGNIKQHFAGIPGYTPTIAVMGDQSRLTKQEIYKELGIE